MNNTEYKRIRVRRSSNTALKGMIFFALLFAILVLWKIASLESRILGIENSRGVEYNTESLEKPIEIYRIK